MAFNIKNMKPIRNGKHEQGYYAVINKHKYIGDFNNVIYRSSYERTFYAELDTDPNVLYWCVEPPQLKIKYFNKKKRKWASYFPDAFCVKMVGGVEVKCLIEVKPKSKLKKPVEPKTNDSKKMISYQRRMDEYNVLDAKRKAAVDFCKIKGMEYIFITENTVKPKK